MKADKKLITLQGLDLRLSVDKNINLFYDGIVEDMLKHNLKLIANYSGITKEELLQNKKFMVDYAAEIESIKRSTGLFTSWEMNGKTNCHIYQRDMDNVLLNAYILAHEEGHFCQWTNNLGVLQQDIKDRSNHLVNLENLEKWEVGATIICIHKLNLDGQDIYHKRLSGFPIHNMALEIWEDSKIPIRKVYTGMGIGKLKDWLVGGGK